MGNLHGRMPTQGRDKEQSDLVEHRRRVATWADGNTVSYEDTNFIVSESLSVLDIQTDLGRRGHWGYFINDGPGDIKVETSFDGTNYGGQHTLHGGDILVLDNLNINRIRLTHIDNTSYRCLVS